MAVNGSVRERARRERLPNEERQKQILKVAGRIFRSRPYGDVSLEEIAEAAGIARGLINHHFGTKRELYLAVIRRALSAPLIPVPGYIHGTSLEQRVRESFNSWLSGVERNPKLWLDSIRGAGIGDLEVVAMVEEARELAVERVAEVAGLGPVEELSAQERGLLRTWISMAEAAVIQWIEYDRLTREEVFDLMVEFGTPRLQRMIEERAGQ